MTEAPPTPDDPKLAQNVMWFARALRGAGLAVGPGRTLDAVRAVAAAGFTRRDDFYWTLHAVFVARPEERAVFDQVFRLFWRDPRYLEHMMALLVPQVRGGEAPRPARPAERRAFEALSLDRSSPRAEPDEDAEVAIDMTRTASGDERLRSLDFEQMSAVEMARAKRLIAGLRPLVPPIASRRYEPGGPGAVDPRRTLRGAMRRGGEVTTLARRSRAVRFPALVALCDISGSMAPYSRAILHFLHAAGGHPGEGWSAIHTFTFGTRLTNVTRALSARDVDAALAAAGAEAPDWEGGTRIGAALRTFNRDWLRRVTGTGAVVLLITDGLERGDPDLLGAEARRLRLSVRRKIWLNPLLRWDGFAPRAAGIRALLPHVDEHRPGHNIAALEGLVAALDPRTARPRHRSAGTSAAC